MSLPWLAIESGGKNCQIIEIVFFIVSAASVILDLQIFGSLTRQVFNSGASLSEQISGDPLKLT